MHILRLARSIARAGFAVVVCALVLAQAGCTYNVVSYQVVGDGCAITRTAAKDSAGSGSGSAAGGALDFTRLVDGSSRLGCPPEPAE